MGQLLRKLDLIALTASGDAANKLRNWLQNIREDVANAIAGTTSVFHKGIDEGSLERNADATDLPTALVLVNSLRTIVVAHLASTGFQGAHAVASGEAIAAPVATDLATAETLANELKADYNTHLTESGVHLNNDSTNAVSSADATDLGTLLTLVNEIKADSNAHVAAAMSASYVE